MQSFGFRVLIQSSLSILTLSTACAADAPWLIRSYFEVSVAALRATSPTRVAQNAPDRGSQYATGVPNAAALNVPNTASVSLQMFPEQTAGVGNKISFRVTTKKAGYVLLIDIDANGTMAQIFPSPELIAESEEAAMNFLRPGEEMLLPNSVAKRRGFEYVATPPLGSTAVVAILSDRRVQILDLPDVSPKTRSEAETVRFLAEWTNQLRVPDPETGKLQQSNWSFDIKRYRIQ
jgi:Domain of unknown function (DUF4384)